MGFAHVMTVAVAVLISFEQLACTSNVPDCFTSAACSGNPAATPPPVLMQASVRTSQVTAASGAEKNAREDQWQRYRPF